MAVTLQPDPADRGVRGRGRPRTALLVLAPTSVLLALAGVLTLSDGGFAPTDWYPAALFVLALLAVVLGMARPPRPWVGARAALAALALLTAWGYATIAWAQAPGLAWDGANRMLLYLMVLALVALRPWRPREARWLLVGLVALLSALAAGVLLSAALTEVGTTFIAGRLAAPMGYPNAAANLWLVGAVPALGLAVDPRLAWPLRGLALGAAGLLAQVSLISQSRGAIVAFVAGVLVLVALGPRRWPALLASLAVVGLIAPAAGTLLAVSDAAGSATSDALSRARVAVVVVTLALVAVGCAAAALDRRVRRRIPLAVRRRGGHALLALAAVALVAGVVATGNPASWVHDRWVDFKSAGYSRVDRAGVRLAGGLGSNRYDFYRVGFDEFVRNPVGGVGIDSFGPAYLVAGRSDEFPHYAHSFLVSFLAETGAVGALALAAFLLLATRAFVRARRSLRPPARAGPQAAALAGAVVFLAGAAVDWLWQFTALGVIAFALIGVAIATSGRAADVGAVAPERTNGRAAVRRLAAAMAAAAAGLSLALPAIAARYTAAAYGDSDAATVLARLGRAADYNPISADPLLAKAIVLRRTGRPAQAIQALDEALGRDPDNWFAYFERAMLRAGMRAWPAAVADVRRAQALNPRQPVVGEVAALIARRGRVDPDRIEAQLRAQAARKVNQRIAG